jgi:DNA recombination protein RmuC
MTPILYIAVGVALAALIIAVVALIAGARRRDRGGDLPAVIQQIDHVRGELRELTELFLVPSRRGAAGETMLAELLAAWLPPKSYTLQHGFANGARVDAVVRLGSRLVPIDSKFPLESVRRHFAQDGGGRTGALPADVIRAFRTHITDIASRYINPSANTLGFALMYIPSERVYIELFAERNDELMRFALEQNVVPVSPATLFLYLQTVSYGLRGLSVPDDARRLLDDLRELRADLVSFGKTFDVAGGHLRNLSRAYDEAGSRLNRMRIRVSRLSGETDGEP